MGRIAGTRERRRENVADLHPEVQKEIDRLAKWYTDHYKIGLSTRDDMLRVVALAVQLEREECAKVCENGTTCGLSGVYMSNILADAIRRRGKP